MTPNWPLADRLQAIYVKKGICPPMWKPGVLTQIRLKTLLANRGKFTTLVK